MQKQPRHEILFKSRNNGKVTIKSTDYSKNVWNPRSVSCGLQNIAVVLRMNHLVENFVHHFHKTNKPYKLVSSICSIQPKNKIIHHHHSHSHSQIQKSALYRNSQVRTILSYMHFVNSPSNVIYFARIINSPNKFINDTLRDRIVTTALRDITHQSKTTANTPMIRNCDCRCE